MDENRALATLDAGPLVPEATLPPDRTPHLVYLAGLSGSSPRAMRNALSLAARTLTDGSLGVDEMPWHLLRNAHIVAIKARLVDAGYAARTTNLVLAALRGTLKAAWRLGLLSRDELERTIDVKGVRIPDVGDNEVGRALSDGELLSLFRACADRSGAGGARDAALLAVLSGAGLRRAEAVALDLEDYEPDAAEHPGQGRLHVRSGKGGKRRTLPVSNGTKEALDRWLEFRGMVPGPLFVAVDRIGRIQWHRLSTQAVYEMIGRRAKAAGVTKFSPHDLRRTYVSRLLEVDVDLSTVQTLAGHASPTTTARYDKRGSARKHAAVARLAIPYVRVG